LSYGEPGHASREAEAPSSQDSLLFGVKQGEEAPSV